MLGNGSQAIDSIKLTGSIDQRTPCHIFSSDLSEVIGECLGRATAAPLRGVESEKRSADLIYRVEALVSLP